MATYAELDNNLATQPYPNAEMTPAMDAYGLGRFGNAAQKIARLRHHIAFMVQSQPNAQAPWFFRDPVPPVPVQVPQALVPPPPAPVPVTARAPILGGNMSRLIPWLAAGALAAFLLFIAPGWALGNPIWDEFGNGDGNGQQVSASGDKCPNGNLLANNCQPATGQPQPQGGQQPQSSSSGSFQLGCTGKDVGAVQRLIGLSVVCLGTEYDAYTWRSVPIRVNATVADGWIATLHLSNDKIVVTEDPGTYEIVAATFRRKAGYPSTDAVHNACALLAKEQAFGASQTPSFPVEALGFSCSNGQVVKVEAVAPSAAAPQPSGLACPGSSQDAANLLGGNAGSWKVLPNTDNTGWKYGPGASGATLTAPSFGRIDYASGSLRNGQSAGELTEASYWCNG